MLLHTCCAPCALPIIEYLIKNKKADNLSLFFSNSNIYPKKEYEKRLEEVRKIARIYNLKFSIDPIKEQEWIKYLKKNLSLPLEEYKENGERCKFCFSFRLKQSFIFAKKQGFKNLGTTLSINCWKDTSFINSLGKELENEYRINYHIFPLNMSSAHKKEIELSKKYRIYRQKYCGCKFSL